MAGLCGSPLHGELLYSTEFEDPPFTVGPHNWTGTDGWFGVGIDPTDEVEGIDPVMGAGLGQTAYLGFEPPSSTLVTVARSFDYDPIQEGTERIQIDTLLGIEDSDNGFRDSFFLTIYNSSGDFLAAIRFSNELATYGIWRNDGVGQFDTGISFIHGEVHLFCIEIDLQNNRWKADIDGIPLFANAPFTATAKPRNLGLLAVEWQIASPNGISEYGNNWLLFADCYVWAIPPGEKNFLIDAIDFDLAGQPVLEFTGEPGWTYQVEYSEDLSTWHTDLPGSTFTGLTEPVQITYTDPTTRAPAVRYYRVVRTVTP